MDTIGTKTKEPVTYRLRVWQLMQGQNGVAAMKSNSPVVDKEVREITQATVTGNIYRPMQTTIPLRFYLERTSTKP